MLSPAITCGAHRNGLSAKRESVPAVTGSEKPPAVTVSEKPPAVTVSEKQRALSQEAQVHRWHKLLSLPSHPLISIEVSHYLNVMRAEGVWTGYKIFRPPLTLQAFLTRVKPHLGRVSFPDLVCSCPAGIHLPLLFLQKPKQATRNSLRAAYESPQSC